MTSEEGRPLPECGDSIDGPTFEQIIEMDEEDDNDFSKSIVYGFFEQAEQTFEKMDNALEKQDLAALSSLGHFLKGSSATLGLTHVRNSCEKIQHWGHKKDASGVHDKDDDECLENIRKEMPLLRTEYAKVEAALRLYYNDNEHDASGDDQEKDKSEEA